MEINRFRLNGIESFVVNVLLLRIKRHFDHGSFNVLLLHSSHTGPSNILEILLVILLQSMAHFNWITKVLGILMLLGVSSVLERLLRPTHLSVINKHLMHVIEIILFVHQSLESNRYLVCSL